MSLAESPNGAGGRVLNVGRLVRAPKTAEIIAASIRKSIVQGDLKEGDSLPSEADLMAQFGVSRPTLREAFRILETESLISIRRGSRGGAQVMTPELSTATRYVGLLLQMQRTTIGEIFEARSVTEVAAARLLAGRRVKQDLIDLNDVMTQMSDLVPAVREKDPAALKEWSDLSLGFHQMLVERSRNRALYLQWSLLSEIIERHAEETVVRTVDHPQTAETVRKSLRSYQKLIERIEQRDASAAADHWQTHMEVSSKILTGRGESQSIVELFD
ncbi:FadR/GntR family transcriptional regulator [Microbacterium sp. No. 7]|uniref:FadR/GntR family transcriptional regulator n=1 Tax=Microbacterium sp. No. 7 TaxID=1714373 RepID=UPI0006D2358A|nr:GntR family transcriptional regulator [Microbacterium sp. No. 7]ALJ18883.1 hypothetical protein AOA12_02735 [Microbacterium sp. No. 7]